MSAGEYNPYLPHNYDPPPDPTLNWRARDSGERQRRGFEALACELALMAWTWPVAPIAWPMIWMGGTR